MMLCNIRRFATIVATGIAVALQAPAWAHKSSDSYLSLVLEDGRITGQWDIALRDLNYAIGIDTDNDGVITWGELRAHHPAIAAYALSNLKFAADERACATRATDHLVDEHSDGAYEVLRFAVDCPAVTAVLSIKYNLLFDLDPLHRGLLKLEDMRISKLRSINHNDAIATMHSEPAPRTTRG